MWIIFRVTSYRQETSVGIFRKLDRLMAACQMQGRWNAWSIEFVIIIINAPFQYISLDALLSKKKKKKKKKKWWDRR